MRTSEGPGEGRGGGGGRHFTIDSLTPREQLVATAPWWQRNVRPVLIDVLGVFVVAAVIVGAWSGRLPAWPVGVVTPSVMLLWLVHWFAAHDESAVRRAMKFWKLMRSEEDDDD